MFIQAVGGTNKPQPISTAIKTLDMRAPRKTKNGRCSLGNRRWVAVLDNIHVLLHCQCILVWVQLISYIYAKVSCAILVLDSSKIVIRIYNCADSSEAMSICFEIPCLWILQGLHHPSALTSPMFRSEILAASTYLSNCVVSSSLVICNEPVAEVPLCWRFNEIYGGSWLCNFQGWSVGGNLLQHQALVSKP